MSNKSKKRCKKYTPKPVKYSAINAVLVGQHNLDDSQQRDLIEHTRAAFERLKTDPNPARDDLVAVKLAIEIAARIADTSQGGAVVNDTVDDALRCIQHCMVRKVITGRYRFTGDELRIIEPALDLHDAIVGMATCKQMRDASNFLRGWEYRTTLIKQVA